MNFKHFFIGVAFLYGIILLASFFNLPVIFFIPISIAGIDIGKLATAIILFLISFVLSKK
ncbi:MAG: hypothetical protein NC918_00115 [Candidatus Omnitrophica bacterium]|nr:hypothetical protein [Candidatus Omnitrophota bacterium]